MAKKPVMKGKTGFPNFGRPVRTIQRSRLVQDSSAPGGERLIRRVIKEPVIGKRSRPKRRKKR